jgi:hypothetical protein
MQRTLLASMLLAASACASSVPSPVAPPAPEPAAAPVPPRSALEAEPARAASEPAPASSTTQESATAPAPPETPPATEPAPEPAKPPPAELEGTLVSRTGRLVKVRLGHASLPEVGTKASLLRHFSGKSGDKTPLGALGGLFGGNVSIGGWLAVADVVVTKVDSDVVTLEIEQERSKMVLNGKPVNHFSAGAKIRLASRLE